MSNNEFFSISYLGAAKHTPETQKIWLSWPYQLRTHYARLAVLRFAQDLGFSYNENEYILDSAKNAFEYLRSKTGRTKSYLIRTAILDYSQPPQL